MRDPRIAEMVRDAFLHFDGDRYLLHGWCVMPNHVHMVAQLIGEHSLSSVLHSVKSFTAHKANALLGRKESFWQREYYDRIIRNEAEYIRTLDYVYNNPEKAGLEDWPYAGFSTESQRDAGDTGTAAVPAAFTGANPAATEELNKWDIFYYVYGLLHHPGYREKYADCLKRELPRIPNAPDFWAFADAGKKLARLHVDYEDLEPYDLEFIEADDEPLDYRVEKMKLLGPNGKTTGKVDSSEGYAESDRFALVVNHTLTLDGIPPAVFDYRLGNRSALEWVIDQYRVKTDKRSGITSDPNRQDDPEYIVRLVGQVVGVSVETVALVTGLPEEFGG